MFDSDLQYKYAVFISWFVWGRAEGHEFAGDNPIQISVLQFLVVLILCKVECFVVEPAQLYGILQTVEAVQQLTKNRFTVHL